MTYSIILESDSILFAIHSDYIIFNSKQLAIRSIFLKENFISNKY